LSQELVRQQYKELTDEWTQAEDKRQRVVDRYRALDRPITLDDPIWEEWDEADERAGSARVAVRSFLAANEHDRQR
jgi:hypothetical protein